MSPVKAVTNVSLENVNVVVSRITSPSTRTYDCAITAKVQKCFETIITITVFNLIYKSVKRNAGLNR